MSALLRLRRVITAGFAVAATLVLAACASIPSAGAVKPGVALGDSNSIELDILARGPQEGDSTEQILQGFLAAAASPQLDYRVAREFLTTDFSKEWKPDSIATVDQGAQRELATGVDNAIALRIRPVASVSNQGVYQAVSTTSAETRTYAFTQVNGQWRISKAPQGIVIDQSTFGIVFGTYSLQFFSPDSAYFVPDVRWFARRETTQTAIVRALVDGPVEWLAAGVVSAIPKGARLDANSVPVTGATATVNLAVESVPNATALSRIQTQLAASLTGVSGIGTVALAINGTTENAPMLQPAPIASPAVDPRPAVLGANGFGYVSAISNEIEPIAALSQSLVNLAPTSIALGLNARVAAAQTSAGIFRVTAEGAQQVFTGTDWAAPTIDPAGGIWSTRDSAKVVWRGADGGGAEFNSNWGDTGTVTGMAVSRDGSRIVATLQTGTLTRVVASAIARGGDGSPTAFGSPTVVAELSVSSQGVSWADATTVIVLSSAAESSTLSFVTVGGQVASESGPQKAAMVAGGNGSRDARIRTSSGDVMQPSGASWQVRSSGVSVLAQQLGIR